MSAQGSSLRFAPVRLQDSQLVRLGRLHPKAVYKPTAQTLSVPHPAEGSGRLGAAPLRDRALLDWCTRLVTDVVGEVTAPTP